MSIPLTLPSLHITLNAQVRSHVIHTDMEHSHIVIGHVEG